MQDQSQQVQDDKGEIDPNDPYYDELEWTSFLYNKAWTPWAAVFANDQQEDALYFFAELWFRISVDLVSTLSENPRSSARQSDRYRTSDCSKPDSELTWLEVYHPLFKCRILNCSLKEFFPSAICHFGYHFRLRFAFGLNVCYQIFTIHKYFVHFGTSHYFLEELLLVSPQLFDSVKLRTIGCIVDIWNLFIP